MSPGPPSETSCWVGPGGRAGAGGHGEAAPHGGGCLRLLFIWRPSALIPTLDLPPLGLVPLCIGLGPRPALLVLCVRLEQGSSEQDVTLACWDLGRYPGCSEATPACWDLGQYPGCSEATPAHFLFPGAFWKGEATG